MRGMVRHILAVLVIALVSACAGEVYVRPAPVVVGVAPPPEQVEVIPVAPRGDVIWLRGHWNWNGQQWIWVRGRYVGRRRGWRWVPAHYEQRGGAWVYVAPHWAR